MSFFARPDLSNEQFKQLSGSTLTLSGTTQIATVSGLTLTDGVGGYRPIVGAGGNLGDVLTLAPDGSTICLMQPTGSGGTGFYSCASPTTCTVGGLINNTAIFGCSIEYILQTILVPTVCSDVTNPSATFILSPSTTIYEVGQSVCLTGCSTFNQGSVTPLYDSTGSCIAASGPRSGVPNTYGYVGLSGITELSSALFDVQCVMGYAVQPGNNTWSLSVIYDSGTTVYNSTGGTHLTALPSGSTTPIVRTITGIYPFFYGTVASGSAPAGDNRPAPSAGLITGGTKVVQSSTGTISINFGSTSDDYIWFAIPNASTSKTCWFINASNNGLIGGVVSAGGNLFPDFDSVTGVTTTFWSGQTYKLYISNYQTAVNTAMQLRNS